MAQYEDEDEGIDDQANEFLYLKAMHESGEWLSEDDLLMLGIIED